MTDARGRRVLAVVTWSYVAWSLAPVIVSLAASVGVGPASETGSSLGLDAYRLALGNDALSAAFRHSAVLAITTVCAAVTLGTMLGLALPRLGRRAWHPIRASILGAIVVPHLALAVALFNLFVFVVRAHLGTGAQTLAHVTIALPFVTLIVWTRVLLLDPSYEEQAADLGASPLSTVRRVLLPLCGPAIVVAAAVAFTISFNEVPLSDLLCIGNDCLTVPVIIGAPRGDVTAAAFALSAMATATSISLLALGVAVVTRSRRRRVGEGRPRPDRPVLVRPPW